MKGQPITLSYLYLRGLKTDRDILASTAARTYMATQESPLLSPLSFVKSMFTFTMVVVKLSSQQPLIILYSPLTKDE